MFVFAFGIWDVIVSQLTLCVPNPARIFLHIRVAWILGTITDFDDVHMTGIFISPRTLWCNFCRYSTSLNPFFSSLYLLPYMVFHGDTSRVESRAEKV